MRNMHSCLQTTRMWQQRLRKPVPSVLASWRPTYTRMHLAPTPTSLSPLPPLSHPLAPLTSPSATATRPQPRLQQPLQPQRVQQTCSPQVAGAAHPPTSPAAATAAALWQGQKALPLHRWCCPQVRS